MKDWMIYEKNKKKNKKKRKEEMKKYNIIKIK